MAGDGGPRPIPGLPKFPVRRSGLESISAPVHHASLRGVPHRRVALVGPACRGAASRPGRRSPRAHGAGAQRRGRRVGGGPPLCRRRRGAPRSTPWRPSPPDRAPRARSCASAIARHLADGSTRVIADVLVETANAARVSTWRFDIAPGPSADQPPLIRTAARLSVVDGLVRLALSEKQYAVRDLRIRGEDLEIVIPSGVAYVAEVHGLPTAVVVLGDGEVTFSPAPEYEKGQLRLFTGDEVLRTRVSRLFLRVNPSDAAQRLTMDALRPMDTDRSMLDRARKLFGDQVGQSYSLDLNDLSRENWNLVPQIGDFLVDMDVARFGLLSYARSAGDSEDVSLFDRRKRKNLSVYTSARNLAVRGTRRYDEADRIDYTIDHYNVDVSFDPGRLWLEGRADLDLRITGAAVQTLTLRLAEPLVLRAVTSDEFGRLLALRVRGQNNIVVNLPDTLRQGQTLRLRVSYGGRLPPAAPDREAVTAGQPILSEMPLEPEPRYVYSHRSYWYPQSSVAAFATARISVTVPTDFTVLGSGVPDPPTAVTVPDARPRRTFVFRALQPTRYLSIAVSRFVQVVSGEMSRPRQDADDDCRPPAVAHGQGRVLRRRRRADLEPAAADEPRPRPPRHDPGHPPLLQRPRGRRAVSVLQAGARGGRASGRAQSGVHGRAAPTPAGHAVQLGARSRGVRRLPAVLRRARSGPPVLGTGRGGRELPRAVDQRGLRPIFCAAVRPQGPPEGVGDGHLPADVPVGARGQRPGAHLARLPHRAPEERQPDVPRHGLQQERPGAAHAAAARRRRGVLARAAALLRPEPLPPRRHRRPARRHGSRVGPVARAVLRAMGLRLGDPRDPAHLGAGGAR